MGGLDNRQKEMFYNAIWLEEKYPQMCKRTEKSWGSDLRLNYHYKNIK